MPRTGWPGPSSSHPGGGARPHRGRTAPVPRRCRHVPAISLGFGRERERERREIQSRVKNEKPIIPSHQLPPARALRGPPVRPGPAAPLLGGEGSVLGVAAAVRLTRSNQRWEEPVSGAQLSLLATLVIKAQCPEDDALVSELH